ncbi:MAG: radical SAM protein, partial [Cetobacterium sp.]
SKLYSICLLICVKGQTKEMIKKDIELGLKYFKSITINIFINNGTIVERDEELVKWFVQEYSYLQEDSRVELLIDNKDLGVFEQ